MRKNPSQVDKITKNYTVVSGGALNGGEWNNARRAGAIEPAGRNFSTKNPTKQPAKTYGPSEWTVQMRRYAEFVKTVSPHLVGREVSVVFIEDPEMVHGQFFGDHFDVNLAWHRVDCWQANIELMLHELAHTVVGSNDHLVSKFYETVGRLGARLAILMVRSPFDLS